MIIRRIKKRDCNQEFKTGEKRFDYDEHGDPIELSYYLKKNVSSDFFSYILEEKGEIMGVLLFRIVEKALYLSRIGIKQKYCKKGYGYNLHKFMMDIVGKKGIKGIVCEAHEDVFYWFKELGYLNIREYADPHWGKSATMLLLIG